jgi:hypothetical protein
LKTLARVTLRAYSHKLGTKAEMLLREANAVILLLLATILISCGPKPATPPPAPAVSKPVRTFLPPTELTARPFHKRIDIVWKTNRTESTVISGYYIYLWSEKDETDKTFRVFRRVNSEPYPGDTDSDISHESYSIEDVNDGMIYRVYVTTAYPDGRESARSNAVEVIPRPEGSFTLRESFKGNESGFSFCKMKSVPTDDLDNDIYLASIKGTLSVASPQRINVVLRQSGLYGLSEYSSLEATSPIYLEGLPQNAIPISNQMVFVLQDQDKCYALLCIDSLDPKEKTAKISFIYQTRPQTLVFH